MGIIESNNEEQKRKERTHAHTHNKLKSNLNKWNKGQIWWYCSQRKQPNNRTTERASSCVENVLWFAIIFRDVASANLSRVALTNTPDLAVVIYTTFVEYIFKSNENPAQHTKTEQVTTSLVKGS